MWPWQLSKIYIFKLYYFIIVYFMSSNDESQVSLISFFCPILNDFPPNILFYSEFHHEEVKYIANAISWCLWMVKLSIKGQCLCWGHIIMFYISDTFGLMFSEFPFTLLNFSHVSHLHLHITVSCAWCFLKVDRQTIRLVIKQPFCSP